MAENRDELIKYYEYRKKRVKRLKTLLCFFAVLLLLCPSAISIYSLGKISKLEDRISNLQNQIDAINTVSMQKDKYASNLVIPEYTPVYAETVLSDRDRYPGKKLVYLTFDDGPSKYTDEILDVLDEYGVKATFFVLAKDGMDERYQRIVTGGHSLGVHSYTHKYDEIYKSADAFALDVENICSYVYNITGVEPYVYRFPGGSSNKVTGVDKNDLFNVLEDNNLIYYDWNVSSGDAVAGGLSSDQIYKNVIGGINSRDDECVVLMHDAADKYSTVSALRDILNYLCNDEQYVCLPITKETTPVVHVSKEDNNGIF